MSASLFDPLDTPALDRPPIVSGVQWTLGVDPGLTGALAFLADGQQPRCFVMPVYKENKKVRRRQAGGGTKTAISVRTYLDLKAIRAILLEHNIARAFLEIQQPHNKPEPQRCPNCGKIMAFASPQGLTSTFTTGRNCGLIEGVLVGLGIDYEAVHPLTWQPTMLAPGKGDTKGRALIAVKEMWPDLDLRANDRCRTDHEGKVDALLIARYGQMRMAGDVSVEYDEALGF